MFPIVLGEGSNLGEDRRKAGLISVAGARPTLAF